MQIADCKLKIENCRPRHRILHFAICILQFAILPAAVRAQTAPPAPVKVAEVVRRDVQSEKTFSGTVMPARRSTVGTAVDGRVEEFLVNEGDAVKKGQPLVRLETTTVDLEVAVAGATLQLRQHELTEMKNGTRPEEKAQAKARAAAAEAIAQYARRRMLRLEDLARKGSTTADEYEQATSTALEAEKLFDAAKRAWELADAGPRPEQIAQAAARLEMARHDLARLKDIRSKYTIVAPFDGYISAENTEVGAWINKGGPVVEVVELAEVEVAIMVLEDHVVHLREGMAAKVMIGALTGQNFTGPIAHIVPLADTRSRSFPVKVRLKNTETNGNPTLKAGMFAQVVLPAGQTKDALVVPRDAIVLGQAKPLVYVVDRDGPSASTGKVRPVTVTTGLDTQGFVEVRGELKAGDLVVVEGNERRRPQEEVRF
jgi:multidrug efflux pump subunit AcrA (membrane-fusion protein)